MPRAVLTADASVNHQFIGALYSGFLSTFPRRIVQDFLFKHVICRSVPANADGTTDYPILSLRAVEAILRNDSYGAEDVKIAHPQHLSRVIDSKTKIVGVSALDPLGIGPATTSWVALWGGQPQNRLKFATLMNRIRRLKERYGFKVVFGGSGAWQLEDSKIQDYYGIDHVLVGEGERVIPDLFSNIESGSHPGDRVIRGQPVRATEVPSILGPTNTSLIEISRGCGKGCKFCSPSVAGRLRSFPIEKILSDAQVYLDRGIKSVTIQSEDTLRYGSSNLESDEDAVLTLYKELFKLGVKRVILTHASMITFAHQPDLISKLTKLIRKHGLPGYGCQPGFETGSGRLIKKLMPNKCYPRNPSEWPEVVREALDVMHKNRWLPCCTLVMGLPGEEEEDILETIDLIKSLTHHLAFFFPLSFLPVKHTALSQSARCIRERMTVAHWELLEVTWKHNLRFFNKAFGYVAEGRFPLMRVGLRLATGVFGSFIMQTLRSRKKEAQKAGRYQVE
jgi:radical SAM superfamily enzyme YgiQ (UPF0313 family)